MCQFLRTHLNWVQNSVFEGELSESGLEKIRHGLKRLINKDVDSVLFYIFSSRKLVKREQVGIEKNTLSTLI